MCSPSVRWQKGSSSGEVGKDGWFTPGRRSVSKAGEAVLGRSTYGSQCHRAIQPGRPWENLPVTSGCTYSVWRQTLNLLQPPGRNWAGRGSALGHADGAGLAAALPRPSEQRARRNPRTLRAAASPAGACCLVFSVQPRP